MRTYMMNIQKIRDYHGNINGEHHRYRSWENCYGYFRQVASEGKLDDRHNAALQLGFYLASWGMYRGSSFLLQYTYTVHLGVVEALINKDLSTLWSREFGSDERDIDALPIILKVIDAIRDSYKPFSLANNSNPASDTLVTKILLGTLGCLPACDRYFIEGFQREGFSYSYVNGKFIERVFDFCRKNLEPLLKEQKRIEKMCGMHYPLMKLIDMYFWQIGYEQSSRK